MDKSRFIGVRRYARSLPQYHTFDLQNTHDMKITLLFTALLTAAVPAAAQVTPDNGDWKAQYVKMENTPEAQFMIRCGDIDNLNFGWEPGFTPFSGKATPSHNYPWERDKRDTLGFDLIQVPSSAGTRDEPCGGDGYSGQRQVLRDTFGRSHFPFRIPLNLPKETAVTSASLQLFVDDFQSPVFCSKFEVTLNGRRAPFIEKAVNALNQTGPIGKLITIKVPADFLDSLKSPVMVLEFDDKTTGAGDGFAIDFIKVLVNPKAVAVKQKGTIKGTVTDAATGRPVIGALITLSDGTQFKSDAKGSYTIPAQAGLAVVTVEAKGFPEKSFTVDVVAGEITQQDFGLVK